MSKIFVILFFLLLAHLTFAQSISEIRKQKEKNEKEITYLNKLLQEAQDSKSMSVAKLNILQQKVVQNRRIIESLNQEMNYFQNLISENEEKITELQSNKSAMLDMYSKLVYGTWKKRNKTSKMMFIFSSSDFNQAYNRFKYFQQIQEYSKHQLELIQQINDSLDVKNQMLKELFEQKNRVAGDISTKSQELQSEQVKEKQYITELQKNERQVRKKLEIENRNRKKLNDELNKLIARQIKKSGSTSSSYKMTPEEKLISDDFVKNKGKLPWPVAEGFISEKYGVKFHSIHTHVLMNNDGVTITTSKNAVVRSVFQGVVLNIFFHAGLNNIVIIAHGDYFTAYSNLMDVDKYIKVGQKINTKDAIGKVVSDGEKGNIFNFQIWKNNIKVDPEQWLAK